MLKQIDSTIPLPKYYQISESIREKIKDGNFRPGEKIPTCRDLSKYFKTTLVTVSNAIRHLEDNGYVDRIHGSGIFVSAPKPVVSSSKVKEGMKKVGVIMHTRGDLYQNLSSFLADELEKNNIYSVPMATKLLGANINLANKEKLLKKCIADGFDSLVVYGIRHFPYKLLYKYRSALRQLNFIGQCESGLDFQEANFINFDAVKAGRMAAEYLVKAGHENFLFITFEKLSEKERARNGCRDKCIDTLALTGMRAVFRKAGFPDSCLKVISSIDEKLIEKELAKLLKKTSLGIFAFGDYRAIPVYKLVAKMGLNFKEKLSIVGLYNTSWTEVLHPALTSISINEVEIARRTADCIIKNKIGQRIMIAPQLIIRET